MLVSVLSRYCLGIVAVLSRCCCCCCIHHHHDDQKKKMMKEREAMKNELKKLREFPEALRKRFRSAMFLFGKRKENDSDCFEAAANDGGGLVVGDAVVEVVVVVRVVTVTIIIIIVITMTISTTVIIVIKIAIAMMIKIRCT